MAPHNHYWNFTNFSFEVSIRFKNSDWIFHSILCGIHFFLLRSQLLHLYRQFFNRKLWLAHFFFYGPKSRPLRTWHSKQEQSIFEETWRICTISFNFQRVKQPRNILILDLLMKKSNILLQIGSWFHRLLCNHYH